MNQEDPYLEIAGYYDNIVGERYEIPFIKKLVNEHFPEAKSVLEIACGTGAVLEQFSESYQVSGLDISNTMLKRAESRISGAQFYQADMRAFDIGEKFDVILCIFNSINHLHTFSDWKKVFECVAKHLNKGGVFIFDIISMHGLKAFLTEPPIIEHVDDKVVLMQYKRAKRGMLDLRVKVFRQEKGEQFKLHEACIREQSFSRQQIEEGLSRHFRDIQCFDLERDKPHQYSEVLFYMALKKDSII